MARWFIQLPKTAPMAPHSWSLGSSGKGEPRRSWTFFL